MGSTGGSPFVGDIQYSSPGIHYTGTPIGMLMLDSTADSPRPPGTPGSPSSFEVPLRCRVVEGCTQERLIFAGDDGLEQAMVAAARALVADGARAITSNCGFMIRYQAAVRNAVDVPVFLSSLLFAPFLLACMGSKSKLGIVTVSEASLTDELLRQAGVTDRGPVIVGDLEKQPAFRAAIVERTGDYDRSAIEAELEQETVRVARALVEKHPEVAALLFECTVLPPYAAAVQRAVGVPVFDAVSLIDLFVAGFAPPDGRRFLLEDLGIGYLSANWLTTT